MDNSQLEQYNLVGSNYQFSGVGVDNLDATEYTLVSLVVDESGSVASFHKELENTIKSIFASCKHSPRKENLLARLSAFDHNIREVHGFKSLSFCKEDDYDNCLRPNGSTALFDATLEALKATDSYATTLGKNDFSVNSIVFIVTDGEDNQSRNQPKQVADAIKSLVSNEHLESVLTVLIGVNDTNCSNYLNRYQTEAGIDKYVSLGDVSESKLAKLAQFISKSISLQSQSLGTGQSASLTI